jgi:hypothetical protein
MSFSMPSASKIGVGSSHSRTRSRKRGHERLDVAGALVVDLARVHDELVHLRREQIADDPEGEVALLVQDRRGRRLLEARLHLRPQPRQELDVGGELALGFALGVRP